MPVKQVQIPYTTVVASRGRRIHAVNFTHPDRTACGRLFSGWNIAPRRLNCGRCKLAILNAQLRAIR